MRWGVVAGYALSVGGLLLLLAAGISVYLGIMIFSIGGMLAVATPFIVAGAVSAAAAVWLIRGGIRLGCSDSDTHVAWAVVLLVVVAPAVLWIVWKFGEPFGNFYWG